MKTHNQVIIQALKDGFVLSPSLAYKLTKMKCKTGTMKLSNRIGEIEDLGYKIIHSPAKKNAYMTYTLDVKRTPKKLLK